MFICVCVSAEDIIYSVNIHTHTQVNKYKWMAVYFCIKAFKCRYMFKNIYYLCSCFSTGLKAKYHKNSTQPLLGIKITDVKQNQQSLFLE